LKPPQGQTESLFFSLPSGQMLSSRVVSKGASVLVNRIFFLLAQFYFMG